MTKQRMRTLICFLFIFISIIYVFDIYFPEINYDNWQEVRPGKRYKTASSTNPEWQIRIIEGDTKNPDIRLVPVWADSLQSTSVLAQNVKGMASVNAGYFYAGDSVNYCGQDGERKASNVRVESRSVFGLTGNHQELVIQIP